MDILKSKVNHVVHYIVTFVKWIAISIIIGLVGGSFGILFHVCVEHATSFRVSHGWMVLLLPIGGLVIVGIYSLFSMNSKGTNQVINSVRTDGKVPAAMAPLIFVSTVITHLLGGSAGREGAALQLGGSIGSQIGSLLHLDKQDMHIVTMCGMSTVFAALFGTPLTAAFFAMEVISIGVMHYSGFIPCILASITAASLSSYFGTQPVRFQLSYIPDLSVITIFRVVLLAVLCAVLSIVFCIAMKRTSKLMSKLFKNEYVRIAAGGCVIVALTYILGTRDYNGAGMELIGQAILGKAVPYAFLLKIIFTAITMGSGYKGGEIIPVFFIGSTFGCIVGSIIGLDPGFAAAIGMVALFCGTVNCPIASIMLSMEVFGAGGVVLFALSCAVSYMLSGNYSLYSSQKIVYSKLKTELIDMYAK